MTTYATQLYESAGWGSEDWLKEATIGLGLPFQRAASVEVVRNVVATHFPKALEHSDDILAEADRLEPNPGNIVNRMAKKVFLGKAFALGVVLLGRAGTAVLGGRPSLQKVELREEEDQDEDGDDDCQLFRVPRSIPAYVHRAFNLRISRLAVARVEVVCSVEAFGQLLEQLRHRDSRQFLAKLCVAGVQGQLTNQLAKNSFVKNSAPVVVSHVVGAARLAHRGCQNLLGERIMGQASDAFERLGNQACELIAGQTSIAHPTTTTDAGTTPFGETDAFLGHSVPDCEILQGVEGPVVHMPLKNDDGNVGSAYFKTVDFRLIERNGFLEFADETPSPICLSRRSYSWTPGCQSESSRTPRPFSLPLNCLGTDDNDDQHNSKVKDYSCGGASSSETSFRESIDDPSTEGVDDSSSCDLTVEKETRTSVQLRNIPANFSRDGFLQMLDDAGFKGRYSFMYLPMAFTDNKCVGYADVCFIDPVDAVRLMQQFQGFVWPRSSDNNDADSSVCETAWSERQTLEEHVERYRDSPVMHKSVSDGLRPVLLEGGVRTEFPPPTRPVRRPRIRPAKV